MPKRVLVVSDDDAIRSEACFAFPADVEVDLATDARDALPRLRERSASVVVVDLQTGSAGGFALLRQMRMDPRYESLPALVLLDRAQDAWLAKQAGANEICVKPVSSDELATSTLSLLG